MNPKAFLDDNHKPEMAVALTPFRALCGFRMPEEVQGFADKIPEFRDVLGDETMEVLNNSSYNSKKKIQACYNALFRSTRNYKEHQSKFISRMAEEKKKGIEVEEEFLGDTFKGIVDSFPGEDPAACFGIFLLNLVDLSPGEAIWVPAGEVHAYLSGDCLEVEYLTALQPYNI